MWSWLWRHSPVAPNLRFFLLASTSSITNHSRKAQQTKLISPWQMDGYMDFVWFCLLWNNWNSIRISCCLILQIVSWHDLTCNKKTSDAFFSHRKKPVGKFLPQNCERVLWRSTNLPIDPCHPPVSEASHDAFVQLVQHPSRSLA